MRWPECALVNRQGTTQQAARCRKVTEGLQGDGQIVQLNGDQGMFRRVGGFRDGERPFPQGLGFRIFGHPVHGAGQRSQGVGGLRMALAERRFSDRHGAAEHDGRAGDVLLELQLIADEAQRRNQGRVTGARLFTNRQSPSQLGSSSLQLVSALKQQSAQLEASRQAGGSRDLACFSNSSARSLAASAAG